MHNKLNDIGTQQTAYFGLYLISISTREFPSNLAPIFACIACQEVSEQMELLVESLHVKWINIGFINSSIVVNLTKLQDVLITQCL